MVYSSATYSYAPPCITLNAATLYLSGVTVSNALGGAIAMTTSVLNVSNSLFLNNLAPYGGAIMLQSASFLYLVSSAFRNNTASNTISAASGVNAQYSGQGGAVWALMSNVFLTSVEFSNNVAAVQGGGIYLVKSNLQTGVCTNFNCISLNLLQNNYAGNRGGGAYLYFAMGSFNSAIVRNNYARAVFTLGNGGAGVFQILGTVTYTNVRFTSNYLRNDSVADARVEPGFKRAVCV
jgi:predicted outer membrane repeat protein